MKFDIYFTIRGPASTAEVPNNTNPVECVNLASLLAQLANNLPNNLLNNPHIGIETVGVRIEERK